MKEHIRDNMHDVQVDSNSYFGTFLCWCVFLIISLLVEVNNCFYTVKDTYSLMQFARVVFWGFFWFLFFVF